MVTRSTPGTGFMPSFCIALRDFFSLRLCLDLPSVSWKGKGQRWVSAWGTKPRDGETPRVERTLEPRFFGTRGGDWHARAWGLGEGDRRLTLAFLVVRDLLVGLDVVLNVLRNAREGEAGSARSHRCKASSEEWAENPNSKKWPLARRKRRRGGTRDVLRRSPRRWARAPWCQPC
jgi:hypothetical protein